MVEGGRPTLTNRVIQCDTLGTVWIGQRRTLTRFDAHQQTFQHYPLPRIEGQNPIVGDMAIDSDGNVWLSVERGGVYRFDPQSETFSPYPPHTDNPETLSANAASDTWSLLFDQSGYLWVGTGIGVLWRYDPASGAITTYHHKPDDPTTISAGRMHHLFEDQQGYLWVSSSDAVNRLNPDTGTVRRYTSGNDLPGGIVAAAIQDDQGYLWISTSNGLARLNPSDGDIQTYDPYDGLPSGFFDRGAVWKAPDGRLFFGNTGGLVAVDPADITRNPYHPPVLLTHMRMDNQSVQIGGDSLLQRPLWETDHITLPPDQSIVSFEFVALSFAAVQKKRYRYQLEGLEDGWNEVGRNQHFATYTHLPPGTYRLRVQATNSDGIWSDHEATLHLTILPHWWETWWFRSVLALLVVAVLVGGYRWRVYTIEQHNRQLAHQVATQTSELRQALGNEKQAHAFLNTVIESLTYPFYVINVDTYEVEIANAAARALNPTGGTCYAMIYQRSEPCTGEYYPCPLQRVRDTGQPALVQHTHYDQNNDKTIYDIYSYPIFNEQGQLVRVIEHMIDVTPRHRVEEQLRESEEKYRLLFAEERDAISLVEAASGQIFDVKPAWETLYGYQRDEALTMLTTDINAEPHQDDDATFLGNNQTAFIPLCWHRDKAGRVFPVEMSVSSFRWKGRQVYCIISKDITERHIYEEELEESRRRLSETQRIAQLGSWEYDIDAQEITWSDETFRIAAWKYAIPPPILRSTSRPFTPTTAHALRQPCKRLSRARYPMRLSCATSAPMAIITTLSPAANPSFTRAAW
jgi:PAS domain S-box-containing protein